MTLRNSDLHVQNFPDCSNDQAGLLENGTFVNACVESKKRIPRSNSIWHIVDGNAMQLMFPCLHPFYDSNYSTADSYLTFIVRRKKYFKSQIPELISVLARTLPSLRPRSSGHYDHSIYAGYAQISACLALLLPTSSTVVYEGKPRDDKYFARLGVDAFLNMTGLDTSCLLVYRGWLYGLISLWIDVIEPDREYFEIHGGLVSRDAIVHWLRQAKANHFCTNRWRASSIDWMQAKREEKKRSGIVNHHKIDLLMRGHSGAQDQSAHNKFVLESQRDVLKRLNDNLRFSLKPAFAEVRKEIVRLCASREDGSQIIQGLNHWEQQRLFVRQSDRQLPNSSEKALETLWAYAKNRWNRKVGKNLRDATLLQLAVLGRESPCVFGCVANLLSTVHGIDPRFMGSKERFNLKERLEKIATRVQKQMDELFEGSDLEVLDQEGAADEDTVATIKVAALRQTAYIELTRFLGLPKTDYESELKKLEAGFRV